MRRGLAMAVAIGLAACSKPAPPPEPPRPAGKVSLLPAPDYPDAAVVVADQLAKSTAAHRRLLVYVGATWCEPCRRFHEAAEKGAFDALLPDLDLLVFDADKDRERLQQAGYTSKYIPLFAVPGEDGHGTGRQTEGAIEGPKMVDQLVARVQVMLQGG